jgi:hypothetical protein
MARQPNSVAGAGHQAPEQSRNGGLFTFCSIYPALRRVVPRLRRSGRPQMATFGTPAVGLEIGVHRPFSIDLLSADVPCAR